MLHCKWRDYCETSRELLEEKCSEIANDVIGSSTCSESVNLHSGSDRVEQSEICLSTSGGEAQMYAWTTRIAEVVVTKHFMSET